MLTPSLRGKTVSFDEAISGILIYEIATLLSVAPNDEKTKLIH